MKIYTRTGDQGQTSLLGNQKVSKSDPRICAYGTVDELNAVLGNVRALDLPESLDSVVLRLQNQLFEVGAELACPDPSESNSLFLDNEVISGVERWIDQFEELLTPLTQFILPGGTQAAAMLHLARCVCRRAERMIVELSQHSPVREEVIMYMNRVSDLLFVMARTANSLQGVQDVPWEKDSES